jgi:hypothetical protein
LRRIVSLNSYLQEFVRLRQAMKHAAGTRARTICDRTLLSVPLHVIQCQTRLRVDTLCALQITLSHMRSCCRSGDGCGVNLALLRRRV